MQRQKVRLNHTHHSQLFYHLVDLLCLLVTLSCHCITFSIPLLAFLTLQSKNGHQNWNHQVWKPILSYFSVTTAPYLELSAMHPETPPTWKYHCAKKLQNKMMLPTVFLFFWLVGKQFDHYAINRYADCLEKVKFGSATKCFCKWISKFVWTPHTYSMGIQHPCMKCNFFHGWYIVYVQNTQGQGTVWHQTALWFGYIKTVSIVTPTHHDIYDIYFRHHVYDTAERFLRYGLWCAPTMVQCWCQGVQTPSSVNGRQARPS